MKHEQRIILQKGGIQNKPYVLPGGLPISLGFSNFPFLPSRGHLSITCFISGQHSEKAEILWTRHNLSPGLREKPPNSKTL